MASFFSIFSYFLNFIFKRIDEAYDTWQVLIGLTWKNSVSLMDGRWTEVPFSYLTIN